MQSLMKLKRKNLRFYVIVLALAVALLVAAFAVSSCIHDEYDLTLIDWNTFKDTLYVDILKNQR